MSEEEAARLLAQTGLDLRGYTHMIDKSAINHIFKNHGVGREWRQQHIPVTEEDILRVPEIVANPDSSKKLPQKSRDIECIEHKKRDDGITFIVEEVRTGKKRLALKSIHKVTTGAGATVGSGRPSNVRNAPDKSPEKLSTPTGSQGKSREDTARPP